MNQQCKVCGEPAAGFHFGAFTCEGCKSFFGRSYNNLSSIAECKNSGECVINKKNRTACKACRLRKCLFVGMSKSGSRYGRRSNWFKIHCLLQEQQQQQQLQQQQQQQQQPQQPALQHHYQPSISGQQLQLPQPTGKSTSSPIGVHSQRKEENHLLSLDDYKNTSSPSISSPESHNSDNSVEVSERRAVFAGHPDLRPLHVPHTSTDMPSLTTEILNLPLGFPFSGLLPSPFFPHNFTMFPPYHIYTPSHTSSHPLLAHQTSNIPARHSPAIVDDIGVSATAIAATTTTTTTTMAMTAAMSSDARTPVDDKASTCRSTANNNNDERCTSMQPTIGENTSSTSNHVDHYTKRHYLDAVLKSQRMSKRPLTPINSRSLDSDSSVRSVEADISCPSPQDNPIDLSMKSAVTCASGHSEDQLEKESSGDEEGCSAPKRPAPMDLTTRS